MKVCCTVLHERCAQEKDSTLQLAVGLQDVLLLSPDDDGELGLVNGWSFPRGRWKARGSGEIALRDWTMHLSGDAKLTR